MEICWKEPWFFVVRTSTLAQIIVRAIFSLAVGIFLFLGITQNKEFASQSGYAIAGFIAIVASGVLTFIAFDAGHVQRAVRASAGGIHCIPLGLPGSLLVLLTGAAQWNRSEIQDLELVPARSDGNPLSYPVIVVTTKYAGKRLVGVPADIDPDRLMDSLADLSLPVARKNSSHT
jgi:hypothetical protein